MKTNLTSAGQRICVAVVLSAMLLTAPALAQVDLQPAIDPPVPAADENPVAPPPPAAAAEAAAEVEADASLPPADVPTPPKAAPSIDPADDLPEAPAASLPPSIDVDGEIGGREPIAPTAIDTTFRGKLSVGVQPINGSLVVRGVTPGGAGAAAGLRNGDEIISINGRRVSSGAELIESLRLAGDDSGRASIVISREGALETIDADVTGRIAPTGKRVETHYRASAAGTANAALPASVSVSWYDYPVYYGWSTWPYYPYYFPAYTWGYYPYTYAYYPYGYSYYYPYRSWYAGYYPGWGWGYPYCR